MSKPSVIIETSERCICMNEACANHEIRRDYTSRNIDQRTGTLTIRALCDQCRTFYKVTRKLIDGQWGPPRIEVITDPKQIGDYVHRIASVGELQRKDSHAAAVA